MQIIGPGGVVMPETLKLTNRSCPYNCTEPVCVCLVALVGQGWLYILRVFCGLCICCRRDAILKIWI